jgi:hypothetical protein
MACAEEFECLVDALDRRSRGGRGADSSPASAAVFLAATADHSDAAFHEGWIRIAIEESCGDRNLGESRDIAIARAMYLAAIEKFPGRKIGLSLWRHDAG